MDGSFFYEDDNIKLKYLKFIGETHVGSRYWEDIFDFEDNIWNYKTSGFKNTYIQTLDITIEYTLTVIDNKKKKLFNSVYIKYNDILVSKYN